MWLDLVWCVAALCVLQVVANAVAALSEIQESSSRDVFDITSAVLQKLLAALNECTEWGQVQGCC